jgi:hypothetical protein
MTCPSGRWREDAETKPSHASVRVREPASPVALKIALKRLKQALEEQGMVTRRMQCGVPYPRPKGRRPAEATVLCKCGVTVSFGDGEHAKECPRCGRKLVLADSGRRK